MLGKSTRMVSSLSTTASVSRIPTGEKSPTTDNDYYAWYVRPGGDINYSRSIDFSYGCIQSPDTYMGGSEGVMQVADYGEIQFETWLHSSYGIW